MITSFNAKLKAKLYLYHAMKTYGRVELLHAFLTSELDENERSASCRGRFTPATR